MGVLRRRGVLIVPRFWSSVFPYHLFVKTPQIAGEYYLALPILCRAHQIRLLDTAGQLGGGGLAAQRQRRRRADPDRPHRFPDVGAGHYRLPDRLPALRASRTTVVLDEGWRGHAAGRFAFVTSDKRGGTSLHVASAWNPADRRACHHQGA